MLAIVVLVLCVCIDFGLSARNIPTVNTSTPYDKNVFEKDVPHSTTGGTNETRSTSAADTIVSMVTVYPGTDIYELEGHTSIRITTPTADVAISYGMFDFNKPGFVYRFVKGETDYSVGEIPWRLFVNEYLRSGRRMVEQILDLTPDEKRRLVELIRINLLPENREYRYNYVRDNCATRPLRMVELALNDTIILGQPTADSDYDTFRNYMRHFHANYPWYQFGIDLALGSGIDCTLDNREKSFAPAVMVEQLAEARVGSPGGRRLVTGESTIIDYPADNAVLGPTPVFARPLVLACLLTMFIILYTGYVIYFRGRYPRILTSVFFTVNGLAGILLTFLIFFSVHEASSPNWNFLWLNPLCFIPAISVWIQRTTRLTMAYFAANFTALLLLLVLWIVGVQSPNPAFITLVISDMVLSAGYIAHKTIFKR